MADTAAPATTNGAKADTKTPVVRPERPDEAAYKEELAKAEKELLAAQEKQKANKAQLDLAIPNNKDSPAAKRRAELFEERNQIKTLQQSGKSSRTTVLDKIKRQDEQLKSLIAEQKALKARVPFKSADDVQREIERLQKEVDTGLMKLVDEKKALAEITNLNKQKKSFGGIDDSQKRIDKIKAQIAEDKKQLDDPEHKARSERFAAIGAELDKARAEQDVLYKNVNALRDEKTRLHEDQQKKYQAVKDVKDRYYGAKRAHAEYEREANRIRRDKQRAERDAWEAGKRQQVARQKLEDASGPAYQDEILTAQGLIRYFDPSAVDAKADAGPGKFAAAATRTVEATGFKGTKLAKKGDDEEDYFVGGAGKKKKGGRKAGGGGVASPAVPAEGKFNLSIGVIEELAKVGVEPPMNQADVPSVVDKLKAKLEQWKGDQDRKTKENIAKAQKEIDRLESEAANGVNGDAAAAAQHGATDKAKKPAGKHAAVNGEPVDAGAELEQEEDAADDAAAELEKVKVEDAPVEA